MKCTTWSRHGGFVSVILFKNGTSAAVGRKVYKTKRGAEGGNARVLTLCGENWELQDLPWSTTNPETGEVTQNYRRENLSKVS